MANARLCRNWGSIHPINPGFQLVPIPPSDGSTPRNGMELLAFAKRDLKLDRQQVFALLGVHETEEISDFQQAWELLKQSAKEAVE